MSVIGLSAALALGLWLGGNIELDAQSIQMASLGAVLGFVWARPRSAFRRLFVLALAVLVGLGILSERREQASASIPPADQRFVLEGRPCGSPPYGLGLVLCSVKTVNGAGLMLEEPGWPDRVWVAWGGGPLWESSVAERALEASWVRIRVRTAHPMEPRNPGEGNDGRVMWLRGIGVRVFAADPPLVIGLGEFGERTQWWRVLELKRDQIRFEISERLSRVSEGGALLAALAVGDRRGLSLATTQNLRRSGLVHLLAISGVHVLLVGSAFLAILRRLLSGPLSHWGMADPRLVLAVASALGVSLYAFGSGFGVPAQRAVLAWWAGVFAFSSGRVWRPLNVWSFAAFVVLAWEPATFFEVGAQLSFLATAALIGSPGSRPAASHFHWAGRFGRMLAASLRSTCLVLAVTSPLVAWQGWSVSAVGLVANLLAVPFTALVLLPSALMGALCVSWLPTSWVDQFLLPGLAGPADVLLFAINGIVDFLPVPGTVPRMSWVQWLWASAAGGLVVVQGRSIYRIAGVLALVFWLGSRLSPLQPPFPPRLVALDVGQGDAILLQGRQANILIDGARAVSGKFDLGQSVVLPALGALGVSQLDLVILSHADLDHRGGLRSVLQNIPTGALWIPSVARDDLELVELIELARDRSVPVHWVDANWDPQSVGDWSLKVLWPPAGVHRLGRNESSLVIRAEIDRDSVLLTGDIGLVAEHELLKNPAQIDVRVLKVAHHGSRYSSHPKFLAAVTPEISVISARCRSQSGLPAAEALVRLRKVSPSLMWTGRDGAVLVPLGRAREGAVGFAASRTDCGE